MFHFRCFVFLVCTWFEVRQIKTLYIFGETIWETTEIRKNRLVKVRTITFEWYILYNHLCCLSKSSLGIHFLTRGLVSCKCFFLTNIKAKYICTFFNGGFNGYGLKFDWDNFKFNYVSFTACTTYNINKFFFFKFVISYIFHL